jgi:exonuclease III
MSYLNIVSWNVRGLTDRHRKILARNWLTNLKQTVHIILIQELKASAFNLASSLTYTAPLYQQIVALPEDGRGGIAILTHPDLKVIQFDVIVPARVAWVQIETATGLLHVANVYAHNFAEDQTLLWSHLQEHLPRGNWIVGGNFNMIETHIDSTCTSPLLTGSELTE